MRKNNFQIKISNEDELLLNVCKAFQNPLAQVKLNLKEINWEIVLNKANAHGIVPIIYLWSLEKDMPEDFPEKKAKGLYNQVLARNMILDNTFEAVKYELSKETITCVPLKGLSLIKSGLYQNFGARQLSDVDLFIRKQDLFKSRNILQKMGYWEKAELSTDILDLCETPTPFEFISNDVLIDLHVGLNRKGSYDITPDEVWQNGSSSELEQHDFLIHLACHAHKHMLRSGVRLISLLDIKLYLENTELDWEVLNAQCRRFNCEREFNSILFITQVVFELPEINSVDDYFTEVEKEQLLEIASHILSLTSFEKDGFSLKKVWMNESAHLNWSLRLFVLFRKIFPNNEFLKTNFRNTPRFLRLPNYYKFQLKKFF